MLPSQILPNYTDETYTTWQGACFAMLVVVPMGILTCERGGGVATG